MVGSSGCRGNPPEGPGACQLKAGAYALGRRIASEFGFTPAMPESDLCAHIEWTIAFELRSIAIHEKVS
jgi:hypothetical protein